MQSNSYRSKLTKWPKCRVKDATRPPKFAHEMERKKESLKSFVSSKKRMAETKSSKPRKNTCITDKKIEKIRLKALDLAQSGFIIC
jgi:hypothetical protein